MSLCFDGPQGTVEQRWIQYALLRDNVQHHLEGGAPTAAFAALHRVADAMGGAQVVLNARQLHQEVAQARAALGGRPLADLALSARTLAMVDRTWPPRDVPTRLAGPDRLANLPALPAGARTLDHVFGALMRALLEVTSEARPHDVVLVQDL